MINITIDGIQYDVNEGITVLTAARNNGIHIPTLCDHPELTPYGGCRLCLVEVEGFRTPQPSCTLPVNKGMVIRTHSPAIDASRKFVLSMIFSERNHFCPFCQESGGDCELQNAAYNEGMDHWPIQPGWEPFPMDASHPYLIIEHQRCILCRRCVRACSEMTGNFTLGVEKRGARTMITADLGIPWGESTCVSCGSCAQVCPTGAIIDRWSSYRGLEKDCHVIKTVCKGCSIGCGLDVYVRDNNLVKIDGDWNAPVNKGLLCEQGRFIPMTEQRQRITTPCIKKDGKQTAVSWEEALNKIALIWEKEKTTALFSTRLPAETIGMISSITGKERTAPLELTGSSIREYQTSEKLPELATLEDLKNSDCVVLMGEDLTLDHQVAGFFIKRNLPQGTKLIVIDHTINPFSVFADVNIQSKTSDLTPEIKALASGNGSDAAALAHKLITQSKKTVFVIGKKANKSLLQTVKSTASALKAKTILLFGGANAVFSTQYGLENILPVEQMTSTLIVQADDLISPVQTLILQKIPKKIVLASYYSALCDEADVVLPVAVWAEEGGTYFNSDKITQTAQTVLQMPPGVQTSQEVITMISKYINIPANIPAWETISAL